MRRAAHGYTMIEIMIAVVVMTIGAAGILAMQGASVRSNQDAAETSVAINFAATWMERLKRDGRSWNARGAGDIANTRYLQNLGAGWVVPAAVAPESAGADFYGFDTPVADARYCVNIRITDVHGAGTAAGVDSVRADVVVWWHRTSSQDTTRSSATCATALTAAQLGSSAAGVDDRKLRKHFLSTVISFRTPVWP